MEGVCRALRNSKRGSRIALRSGTRGRGVKNATKVRYVIIWTAPYDSYAYNYDNDDHLSPIPSYEIIKSKPFVRSLARWIENGQNKDKVMEFNSSKRFFITFLLAL